MRLSKRLVPALAGLVGIGILATLIASPQRNTNPPAPRAVKATLLGDTTDAEVRLVWSTDSWPDDLRGFEVRRRAPGGAWEKLTPSVVFPELSEEKDLTSVEPDAERRRKLVEKRADLIRRKELQPMTFDRFRADLAASPSAANVLSALRRFCVTDPEVAQILGFGAVDRNIRPPMEYGLFAVYRDKVDDSPAAVYASVRFEKDDARLQAKDLRATAEAGGMRIEWKFAAEDAARWSISSFALYRAARGSTTFESLGVVPSAHVEDAWRHWSHLDRTAEETGEYVYAVAPRTAFGRELPARTQVDAKAEKLPPRPQKLAMSQGVLTWEFPKDREADIAAFRIERSEGATAEFQKLADPVDRALRRYEDRDRSGTAFFYRVGAKTPSGRVQWSDVLVDAVVEFPRPPVPTGLVAEWISAGGKNYVRLRWNKQDAGDKLTAGYLFYLDDPTPGKPVRQASAPRIDGTQYDHEIDALVGRKVVVGITAVSAAGRESDLVKTEVFVGGSMPATARNVTATREGETVVVKWVYDREATDIVGFRILDGRQVLADETRLGIEAREWTLEKIDPRRAYTFDVRAVGRNGALSRAAKAEFSAPFGRPMRPSGFRAEWVDQDGRKVIRLSWDEPKGAVESHRLAVDWKAIGVFAEPEKLPKAGPVTIEPKSGVRSYTLRLVAVPAQGESSFPEETFLLAPGRTLPPAAILESYDSSKVKVAVRIHWKYPDVAGLKGFRLYQDGVLVAKEDTLGKAAREWISGTLKAGTTYRYELEAVGENGEVSERGPAREVRHQP